MSKTVQTVSIQTSELDSWSTIIRACLAGVKAAKRLKNTKLINSFNNIKGLADNEYYRLTCVDTKEG